MRKVLFLAAVLATFIPFTFAMASEASPYIMGEWFVADKFEDIQVVTDDTVFSFLNPTPLHLVLEYAFFQEDGTFCGCDIDELDPNGLVRYTMSGEKRDGFLACPDATATHGTMKSIVLVQKGRFLFLDDALQIGFQIHLYPGGRTEAGMKAIPVTHNTFEEIVKIHYSCKNFKPAGKFLLELRR